MEKTTATQIVNNTDYREKAHQYSLFVEHAKDGVVVLQDGICKFANSAVWDISGFTPEEILGQDFFDKIPSKDKSKIEKFYTDRVAGKKVPPVYEIQLACKDGTKKDIEISASVIQFEGRPASLGFLRDITERNKVISNLNQAYIELDGAQSRFKAIIEHAPNIAILGFNSRIEVVFFNPCLEEIFEITSEEIRNGNMEALAFSTKEESQFKDLIQSVLKGDLPSQLKEWSFNSRSGRKKYILSSIFPIAQEGQDPIVVAMSVDITESKQKTIKIEEMNRQIEGFSEILSAILTIKDVDELYEKIAEAVVQISDFKRVLISYFTEETPYRKIIGYKGVNSEVVEKVKNVEMPREKYQKIFRKGIKIGDQSCFIPADMKDILDQKAVIYGEKSYVGKKDCWNKEDNLLVAMKDTRNQLIGIISVDDSKSGLIPTKETVRPLEIFANLISDIIQKKMLETRVMESEEKYRELLGNIIMGIVRTSPGGKILEANPSAIKMFRYEEAGQFLCLNLADLYENSEDIGDFLKTMEEKGYVKNKEFSLKRKDGSVFWGSLTSKAGQEPNNQKKHYDTVIEDITERKKLQEDVRRLSITDELTGLYNRRYFNENLHKEIQVGEKWNSALSLIMLDIDDFKSYNDTFHHLKGDEVIKEVAHVINQSIRKNIDWATRFGGDEYAIVIPGANAAVSKNVADRIRETFKQRNFRPKGEIVNKTLSLGVADCYHCEGTPTPGFDLEFHPFDYEKIATELIRKADKALYKAKNSGKNKVVVAKKSIELSRLAK